MFYSEMYTMDICLNCEIKILTDVKIMCMTIQKLVCVLSTCII